MFFPLLDDLFHLLSAIPEKLTPHGPAHSRTNQAGLKNLSIAVVAGK